MTTELRKAPYEMPFRELSWAFVDVETTGTHPGRDQIIEIAVLRDAPPHEEPSVALTTLVRPEPHQRIGNREIHGITNRDIRKAPTFESIAGLVMDAVADCVVVAHNAVFDLDFLRESFARVSTKVALPYVCTIELRKLLGLHGPCSLDDLAIVNGIERQHPFHSAEEDASIARHVFWQCIEYAESQGKHSFHELQGKEPPRFLSSLTIPLPSRSASPRLGRASERILTRGWREKVRPRSRHPLDDSYEDGVRRAFAIPDFSTEIVSGLLDLRRREQLAPESWRAIHATEFARFLNNSAAAGALDEIQTIRIRQAMAFLSALGWAPGER